MPKTIKLTMEDGRVVRVKWHSDVNPTDAEMRQLVSQVKTKLPAKANTQYSEPIGPKRPPAKATTQYDEPIGPTRQTQLKGRAGSGTTSIDSGVGVGGRSQISGSGGAVPLKPYDPPKRTLQQVVGEADESRRVFEDILSNPVLQAISPLLRTKVGRSIGATTLNTPKEFASELEIALGPVEDAGARDQVGAVLNLFGMAGAPGSEKVIKPVVKGVKGALETRAINQAVKTTAREAAEELPGITFRSRYKPEFDVPTISEPRAKFNPVRAADEAPAEVTPVSQYIKSTLRDDLNPPKGNPSTVSHADTDDVRKLLGFEERTKTLRPDSELMQSAKKIDPFQAVSKVNKGETLTDAEQISMGVRLQGLRKELAAAKEVGDTAKFDELFTQADELATALDTAGSEAGRAMRARRLLIDENFDEFGLKRNLEKAKGPLTAKETKQIEELASKNTELEAQLKQAQDELAQIQAKATVGSVSKRAPRFKKEELDLELDQILKDFSEAQRQLKGQANDITTVIATYGTEGTKLVYRVAVNYAKRGINNLDDLADAVRSHFPELSKQDVIDVIAEKGGKGEPKTASELAKRIGQLQREAKRLSTDQVRARAKAASRQGQRQVEQAQARAVREAEAPAKRMAEIQAKIDEYKQRLKDGDFDVTKSDVKMKTREVLELEDQKKALRRQFEMMRKRANRGPFGKALGAVDTILATMREGVATGDISFPGIQGSTALFTDPKAWKASVKGAFKSYTRIGYEDTINLIKNDPMYGEVVRTKVNLPAISGEAEELFMGSPLQKAPLGVGRVVKAASQSYDGAASIARFNMAKAHIELAKKLNNGKALTVEEYKLIGEAVNSLTGKASSDLGKRLAGADFGRAFFAPSYYVSMFETAYGRPVIQAFDLWRRTGNAATLKVYAKKLGQLYSGAAAIVLSAKLYFDNTDSDWRVDIDPRSTNWGRAYKIVNGEKVTMDLLPPQLIQPYRISAQLFFGRKSDDGKVAKNAFTRQAAVGQLVDGKMAPGPKMGLAISDSMAATDKANESGGLPKYPFDKNMDPRMLEGWKNIGLGSLPLSFQGSKEMIETDALTPVEKTLLVPFLVFSRGPNAYKVGARSVQSSREIPKTFGLNRQ